MVARCALQFYAKGLTHYWQYLRHLDKGFRDAASNELVLDADAPNGIFHHRFIATGDFLRRGRCVVIPQFAGQ
jgi:hypothetical protein